MRIIGIDPGSHRIGYSILDKDKSRKIKLISYGTIEIPPKTIISESLLILHKSILKVLEEYKPEVASVEELFYFKNQKTVAAVYQSRGVILLSLAEKKIKTIEPTVTQIKKGVTGSGKADKKQIRLGLQMILNLKDLSGHDDSWDAIATGYVGLSMLG